MGNEHKGFDYQMGFNCGMKNEDRWEIAGEQSHSYSTGYSDGVMKRLSDEHKAARMTKLLTKQKE